MIPNRALLAAAGAGAIVMLLAVGLITWAWAEDGPAVREPAPLTFPFQGILERNGVLVQAIGSDKVQVQVSLWDAATGGTKVWPAAASVYDAHEVNVYNGRFALRIGEDQPYEHVPATALFLEIQVKMDEDPDFIPLAGRQPFLYAPHAVTATRADGDFQVEGGLTVQGSISSGMAMCRLQNEPCSGFYPHSGGNIRLISNDILADHGCHLSIWSGNNLARLAITSQAANNPCSHAYTTEVDFEVHLCCR